MPTTQLTDRAVLSIAGAEARDFLQAMLTNDISGALPAYAGLLSAQGKTMFDMIVHAGDDDAMLVDVAASHAEALAKRLTMYKLRRQITIESVALPVFARWGEALDRPLDPRLPELGERWIGGEAATDATVEDYHRHRVSLGVPDTPEMTDLLWLETDAGELNGVSYTKGCYVGQENTARMHHRDKLRRRLIPVRGAGVLGPIMAGDREAGELRSRHGELGIAYLRMEYAEGSLTQDGSPVSVVWPGWLPRDAG